MALNPEISVNATNVWLRSSADIAIRFLMASSSNNLNTVGGNQNINLPERFFKMFFELFEELLCSSVVRSDDFDLDNVVDEFNTAVFPSSLIRRGQRTHRDSATGFDQIRLNLPQLLFLDVLAVVV